MSIIAALASVFMMSLSSIQSQQQMKSAVHMISASALQARQLALSSGKPVALLLSETRSGHPSITLLKGTQTTGAAYEWKHAMQGWRMMDINVSATSQLGGEASSFYEAGSVNSPEFGTIAPLAGSTVEDYEFIIFRPDGSIDAPTSDPRIALNHSRSNDESYYCLILLQESSGRARVIWN